ncbi:MAG TPA: ATP-binding protein, partial [Polyangia bacterium]|nr:ATP-binding protein [Polyangia bacterium]
MRILMVGAFIVAVGALVSDGMMSSVLDRSRVELEQNEIVARDFERLLRNLVDLTTSVRGYALSGDPRYLEPYDRSDAALPRLFADLHRGLTSDPAGDHMVTRVETLLAAWKQDVSDPLVAQRAQPAPVAPDLAAGARADATGQRLVTQVRSETDRFAEHQRARKHAAYDRLNRRRRDARLVIVGLFVAAGTFIVVATLRLSRRLSRGITRLVDVSESIADARFDVEIRDERDDLGRLARSLRSTARQLDRRTRQAQALLAAGRALSAPEAHGQLLPALHDAICEIVDLQQMMLIRIDGDEQRIAAIHPPLSADSEVPPLNEPGPIRTNGALAHAIATRRSLIVRDVQDDRWPENAPVRKLGASWYVFVPLVANGRVAAVLGASATSNDGNHYHGDQAFFDLLGQQIAGALTSARLYGELAERNLELERAGRAKSDFLALMSHELRTPLNSIIGFSQVLIDQKYGPQSERQARYLQNIYSSGRHLLQLINDLLDLSKIEAGRFTVEIDRCSLGDLVLEALTTLKPQADAKQLVVRSATPPPPVRADALRVKQVLFNVLSNAIKFTPASGTITLGHELVDEGRSLRFAVSDTGPGISEEDQQRLFLPFVQVGTAAMQGLGSGLGLLLSRQLMELMGGQLGVRSVLGQGATFYFDLPLAQPLTPRAQPAPSVMSAATT